MLTSQSVVASIDTGQLLELIESGFILNICILSADHGMLYYLQNGGNKRVSITYASAGIAFTIFVSIIVYHVISTSLKYWKTFHNKRAPPAEDGVDLDNHDSERSTTSLSRTEEVTYSVVELREPLLSY